MRIVVLRQAENDCTMGKNFTLTKIRGGMTMEMEKFSSFSHFYFYFLLDFPTERVKTLFKIEHLKYLLLKTYVTNNFPQSSLAFPASFSEKSFFFLRFSVLLSIFLIHCLRALKLVLLGSNVPLQLNETLRIKLFNSRTHLLPSVRSDLFIVIFLYSFSTFFYITLDRFTLSQFSLKFPLHLKYISSNGL